MLASKTGGSSSQTRSRSPPAHLAESRQQKCEGEECDPPCFGSVSSVAFRHRLRAGEAVEDHAAFIPSERAWQKQFVRGGRQNCTPPSKVGISCELEKLEWTWAILLQLVPVLAGQSCAGYVDAGRGSGSSRLLAKNPRTVRELEGPGGWVGGYPGRVLGKQLPSGGRRRSGSYHAEELLALRAKAKRHSELRIHPAICLPACTAP